MKGKVLGFDQARNCGIISGADGKRYSFCFAEWKTTYTPQPGIEVDFISNSDIAQEVYSVSGITDATSKKLVLYCSHFFRNIWRPQILPWIQKTRVDNANYFFGRNYFFSHTDINYWINRFYRSNFICCKADFRI